MVSSFAGCWGYFRFMRIKNGADTIIHAILEIDSEFLPCQKFISL